MNAVEIEEAISTLAEQPFEADEFPFAFLEAFGNKATTIKRLRSGTSKQIRYRWHCSRPATSTSRFAMRGRCPKRFAHFRDSPATRNARNRVKFILATDGITLEAEDLVSDLPPIRLRICRFS